MNIRALLFIIAMTMSACATAPKTSAPTSPAVRRVSASAALEWSASALGLELAKSDGGELTIARVDLKVAHLVLLNRPATEGVNVQTAAIANGLMLAMNAAMFKTDYSTSIGYMRNYADINNPKHGSKLKGYVMFNPKNSDSPGIRIGDKSKIDDYNTVFQSHRMWTPDEGILWAKGKQFYYQVGLIGADKQGRALLFFHRATIDVYDLVAQILDLGLDLEGLLYLDGGNHGVMYLAPELGSSSNAGMQLPNILGVQLQQPTP